MKQANREFLEENMDHWITLRDAQYLRGLDGNTRSRMMQVMAEEFQPGYTTDLWCNPCVVEMVRTLYNRYITWKEIQENAKPPTTPEALGELKPNGPDAEPITAPATFPKAERPAAEPPADVTELAQKKRGKKREQLNIPTAQNSQITKGDKNVYE